MGHQQHHDPEPPQAYPQGRYFQQRVARFKTLCSCVWLALCNVLLLIGGDDTVEISFNFNATPIVGPALSSADPAIHIN